MGVATLARCGVWALTPSHGRSARLRRDARGVRNILNAGGPDYAAILRAAAREGGALRIAITSASPETGARDRMRAAFANGDFATWPYDDRYAAAASDPSTLLPGARSVVCIAIPFAHEPLPGRARLSGRISNYAWADDYHAHVRGVLERVAAALDAAAGTPVTRIVCDTAPLAERAFAERAGLGWIGKHTNLIVPELGSFVFLGEIVTTLELSETKPLKKTCGSCSRCVSVCPTGALRGDYTIDAGRCISDLTQRTDAIPRELRALVGDWVWGCDLCQLACPPTRRARPSAAPAFAPRGTSASPSLLELLRVRGGEFKRRYRRTALGWRGAFVLRRNAAVALGNALDRSAVPALATALEDDPHPLVRGHAAWALGRIGSPAALAALRRSKASEADVSVREEIETATRSLETFGTSAAFGCRRIATA